MKGYTIRLSCFRASDTTLDIPRRSPKASSSSRGSLPPITAHTEQRRLMQGCASRPRGSPDQHVKRARLTFSHVSGPFLSTSYALPLRTSSPRVEENPHTLRTSKDKDRARPRKAEDPESPALRGADFPDAAARPRPAVLGSSFRRARWRASVLVRVSCGVGFVLTSAASWTPYYSASLRF
jgi:hypothetical protein